MPQGKTTKFMESVIFGLYNYASSRREAYLLLQLFKTALREEVRQVPQKRGGGGGGPGRRRWSPHPPAPRGSSSRLEGSNGARSRLFSAPPPRRPYQTPRAAGRGRGLTRRHRGRTEATGQSSGGGTPVQAPKSQLSRSEGSCLSLTSRGPAPISSRTTGQRWSGCRTWRRAAPRW